MAYTLKYMSEREAFGRTINKFQVLRHRMAQLATEIEACKQFTLYCCRLHNDGQYAVKECSMAKLLATELSNKVMTQCLQMFGGYGYMEEFKIARMFRDSRIGTIGGGSSEIMREIISKMIIDNVSYNSSSSNDAKGSKTADANSNRQAENKASDENLDSVFDLIQQNVKAAKPLGNTLKFDFGTEQLFIDGTSDENVVSRDNKEAACIVETTFADFVALTKGELNPMSAVMSGKVKIKGDMSVAMKLQTLFG